MDFLAISFISLTNSSFGQSSLGASATKCIPILAHPIISEFPILFLASPTYTNLTLFKSLSTFSITEPLALFSPVARLFTAFVLPPFTSGVFFGGLFKGLLEAKATDVTYDVMIAVSKKLASLVENPNVEKIIPGVFDGDIVKSVSETVVKNIEN